jgi:hypothetical protein
MVMYLAGRSNLRSRQLRAGVASRKHIPDSNTMHIRPSPTHVSMYPKQDPATGADAKTDFPTCRYALRYTSRLGSQLTLPHLSFGAQRTINPGPRPRGLPAMYLELLCTVEESACLPAAREIPVIRHDQEGETPCAPPTNARG